MNILDRITYLRERKNWTEYQLAEHSGITQSTISSWYRKDILPSIPSLEKVCAAFGITLSQFFSEDTNTFTLTDIQKELLKETEHLSHIQLEALIRFISTL